MGRSCARPGKRDHMFTVVCESDVVRHWASSTVLCVHVHCVALLIVFFLSLAVCDSTLMQEAIKPVVNSDDEAAKTASRNVL